jgi:hypothetical protein
MTHNNGRLCPEAKRLGWPNGKTPWSPTSARQVLGNHAAIALDLELLAWPYRL